MKRIAKCVPASLLPLMLAAPAGAADANGSFAVRGVGNSSCVRYFSEANLQLGDFENWLMGFLTAINLTTPGLSDILSGTDLAGAMSWINNYCQENPTRTFSEAARALTIFLRGK